MLSQILAPEHRMSAEKRVVLHSWHYCFSVELHRFLRSVSPTTVIQWRQLTCYPNDKHINILRVICFTIKSSRTWPRQYRQHIPTFTCVETLATAENSIAVALLRLHLKGKTALRRFCCLDHRMAPGSRRSGRSYLRSCVWRRLQAHATGAQYTAPSAVELCNRIAGRFTALYPTRERIDILTIMPNMIIYIYML